MLFIFIYIYKCQINSDFFKDKEIFLFFLKSKLKSMELNKNAFNNIIPIFTFHDIFISKRNAEN